ncbi:hypothetical protein OPW41_18165 [Vibrio europaeus]|uniref:hypothetical protein n=1 Tax=Vibrio europaeus TaxID=300876 RepID=UPI00233EC71C|nr:hypothetical protein [Vibrio europaeus]MDC5753829.1 hypothetical protein [Vibrio europaeus]MDC5776741.1 hypothetical protein [Vibrio europaeus]MDC5796757.1 hypothetical protein [Vibrio europaeus]MDC5801754.1 hypothetical protein [Vibrio europaeus]MDC5815727.1 hypothetical protein [Vibrio europaeus]
MTQRQLAWTYILQFGKKEFTGMQIVQAVELNNSRTRNLLTVLEEMGKIQLVDKGTCILTNRYKVVDASPIPNRFVRKKKPKRPRVNQRIWNSCRVLKVFTLHELCSTASAALSTGRGFLRPLLKARIIRRVNSPDGELFRLNAQFSSECPKVTDDGVRIKERFFPFQGESK